METYLFGRQQLLEELPEDIQYALKEGRIPNVNQTMGIVERKGKKYCTRCQAECVAVPNDCCVCQEECGYCRNCLKMGKVRACSILYSLAEPNVFTKKKSPVLKWAGTLSTQQEEASAQIVQSIRAAETRLLWAVTGAGKTEMLFEGIYYALQQNLRICIASPRVDVCLELAPRIRAAFPQTEIALLYGGMEEPYRYTQLVIATTHQLFRFKEAFDVLIIDEIDAFPFHSDVSLQYAANKARKLHSTLIYLSATPTRQMQQQVKQQQLRATILPARYHGHPLPVPQMKWCTDWETEVLTNFEKTSFGKKVIQYIEGGQRFLLFIPNIQWMHQLEKLLLDLFPLVPFEAVFAKDPKRKEKVQLMRQEKIQFLISSTILERGVTFPGIDVLIIGAEDRVFSESALVQMAGRCGRSPEFPTGEVIYFHDGKSLAMKRAVKQIKEMNHLAKKRGLLH